MKLFVEHIPRERQADVRTIVAIALQHGVWLTPRQAEALWVFHVAGRTTGGWLSVKGAADKGEGVWKALEAAIAATGQLVAVARDEE